MSKQCLNVEQMQHLKELGVDTSNANFYWHRTKSFNNYEEWDEWKLHYGVLRLARGFTAINCEYVRTFTLQDILDLLPYKIVTNYLNIGKKSFSGDILFYIEYSNFGGYEISHFRNENLIDAAYEMLCWVIENGYLETK